MLRVINKETGIFIRDDFSYDEATEIGLDVEPAQGLYLPKWQDGQWVEGATEIPTPTPSADDLKKQLESTDYKIIKCYEYQLAGLELPYDVAELHQERQLLRDLINELN